MVSPFTTIFLTASLVCVLVGEEGHLWAGVFLGLAFVLEVLMAWARGGSDGLG